MSDLHTRALPAGATVHARMAAAYRDGRNTARGRAARVNPWDGSLQVQLDRVLAVMWARGFSNGNPIRL